MARFIMAGFGMLWTILAIAITSSAPSEGPFIVAKIIFPAFGILFIISALFVGKKIETMKEQILSRDAKQTPDGVSTSPVALTACPRCGAAIKTGVNVSPHGDVKCDHCSGWFNIHSN